MFEKKTLLILGAGASQECRLPTGYEIKERIADLLDIRFQDGGLSSGDPVICNALRLAVQRINPNDRNINPYMHAAWKIRDAMPQAISIDNYVDAHEDDRRMQLCGKLAIVRSILDAERGSSMYVDPRNGRQMPDYRALESTWFSAFFQLLTENCRAGQLEQRLANIGLVIFNYDRCIEHYLYHALQTYYRIESNVAAKLVRSIAIFHPYGSAGVLPWYEGHPSAEFGTEPHAQLLLDLAGQIKTFTEGTDPDASDIVAIRKWLSAAELVLFLGFAFHRLNLNLLKSSDAPHRGPDRVDYFGTAKGISSSDCAAVREDLIALASAKPDRIVLRNDLTCAQLLREYWRTLSIV